MTTQVINVPVGSPQRVLVNQPGGLGSVCALPGSGGSVLLEWSVDGVNFVQAVQGAATNPYAIGVATFGTSQFTVVRCTATTAAGIMIVSDVSQVTGGAQMDRQVVSVAG